MNEKEINKSKLSIGKIIVSIIFFTLLWTAVTDAWGISSVIFGEDITAWQKYAYDIGSRIIWVLPVFFLLSRYKTDLPLSMKSMFKVKFGFKIFFLVFGLFTSYAFVVMFATFGRFHINPDFRPFRHITFYLVVGFVEELVYRGWALNSFSAFMSNGKAQILSVIFFILLHWPAYIIKLFNTGVFLTTNFLLQSFLVLITGFLFGYVFRKTKSIWTPIILHAYFDLIVKLLVG